MQEVRGREVQSRVKVDEEDQRRYYSKNLDQFRQPEQVQLREVVVLDGGGGRPPRSGGARRRRPRQGAVRRLARRRRQRDLARGVTSAAIDLGWVSPGDLDKNLETAVWKLPKGSLSEPVQARGGLHLVQVLDRRESRIPPFYEVQPAIQAREQERVFRQEIANYMVELGKKSLIVAKPPRTPPTSAASSPSPRLHATKGGSAAASPRRPRRRLRQRPAGPTRHAPGHDHYPAHGEHARAHRAGHPAGPEAGRPLAGAGGPAAVRDRAAAVDPTSRSLKTFHCRSANAREILAGVFIPLL